MNDQTRPDAIHTEKPQCKEIPCRISFLLRMWCIDETGRFNWRASLEMPETGNRIGFANLEQLFVYLIDLSESRDSVQDKDNQD
jgi:hypothetical protein